MAMDTGGELTLMYGADIITLGDCRQEKKRHRTYLATSTGHLDRELLLTVATDPEYNGVLDRSAYLLGIMAEEAEDLEREFAGGDDGTQSLSYDYMFPQVIDSWIEESAEGRRINLLAFKAPSMNGYFSMRYFTEDLKVRVDPKTSAWILGKFLKLLAFAHSMDISIGNLGADNLMLDPKEHFVLVFDWTWAVLGGLDEETRRKEIAYVAYATTVLLGGDPETGKLPPDDQLKDDRYAQFVHGLACGAYADAGVAKEDFYTLIRGLWGRGYHPINTYPLT